MRRAIEAPMRWIATNAGVEGSIVVQKVKDSKDASFGYNAATDTYEDLVKAGVIDPTKVVRSALQNAASIASLLLTTEAMVSEIPEEKKEAPAGGGPAAAWAECTDALNSTRQRTDSKDGPIGESQSGRLLFGDGRDGRLREWIPGIHSRSRLGSGYPYAMHARLRVSLVFVLVTTTLSFPRAQTPARANTDH